ncbi:MAG: hypothetical protein HOP02_16340 [Methylococcaceae bacterium]|nr:hypothetical protein [Methylococcaceae bacterium]
MFKKITILSTLIASNMALAHETPEYNPSNAQLTIPEVKVGSGMVYNAKLKFDGVDNFKLLSFENTSPNIPPAGKAADVEQWLMKGIYKNWACEATKHAGRAPSPHGENRICSNPLLSASDSGTFPMGAASVKELYSGDTISGYAVGVKIIAGEGKDTWYWYERLGSSVEGDGIADKACEGCHSHAADDGKGRDRTFTRVK